MRDSGAAELACTVDCAECIGRRESSRVGSQPSQDEITAPREESGRPRIYEFEVKSARLKSIQVQERATYAGDVSIGRIRVSVDLGAIDRQSLRAPVDNILATDSRDYVIDPDVVIVHRK